MGDIDAARRAVDALRPLVVLAVLAVLLVAAVGLRRAEARDCRDETPLPADVKLIAPGPDIAPEAARFAGAWTGAWKAQATDTLCATLVVEELFPSGHARVIYGHGTWEPLGVPVPAYWRASGRVLDGVLRFTLPVPDRPAFAYTFAGGALSGTFRGGGNHAVTRAADVSGIGCSAKVTGVTTPPIAASPRDRLTATELLSGASAGDAPVHNDYFMPLGAAAPARHALKGKLSFAAATASTAHRGCRGLTISTPAFSVEFFTHGDRLVPVQRGIVRAPRNGDPVAGPGVVRAR